MHARSRISLVKFWGIWKLHQVQTLLGRSVERLRNEGLFDVLPSSRNVQYPSLRLVNSESVVKSS